ncbi:AAA family ATPase [Candidatus Woesearchaeota archaeon]|nr:AAA family ATPase [Candidatus Woesearchaeota archaeon]
MSLFRDVLGSGESLFTNELALDYSFMPKSIPFREAEQQHMASCMKPLFSRRSGRSLFVFGPPGVGKTVAARHVLSDLEEQTDEVVPVYINCWQHNSSFKVFLEICSALDYKFTQNKRSDELFIIIRQMLNKNSAVFVLDEIDKLADYDFLYSILEEVFRKSIIAITNDRDWLSGLDSRIRSRLMPESLEFRPYSAEETKGILRQRLEYAFVQGVWEDEAFNLVAQKAFELKDIRRGLFIMRQAGLLAEEKASRRITAQHVLQCSMEEFAARNPASLDEDDRFMLDIIRKNSGCKIGDIFRAYQDTGGKAAYKTFQRRIDRFEKDGFLILNRIPGGLEGKTTIINYAADKKLTDF